MIPQKLFAFATLAMGAISIAPAGQAQSLTTLYTFNGGGSAGPLAAYGSNLYGTIPIGNSGNGSVFRFDLLSGKLATVYNFQGGSDGANPQSGLIFAAGQLYGTAFYGGRIGSGTVFAINPLTRAETTLSDFAGVAAQGYPTTGVIDQGGILYGTLSGSNGAFSNGAIYSVPAAGGATTTLYNFAGAPDGFNPAAGLTAHVSLIYGTTSGGGTSGDGTVFEYNETSKTETILYTFGSAPDGVEPVAPLVYLGGYLYGTTAAGGSAGYGTVFRINTVTGKEKILANFNGSGNGATPLGGLLNVSGTLYGATSSGGANGEGVIFSVNPLTGAETTLYTFTGGTDGGAPTATLVQQLGTLYGTTTGSSNCGFGGRCATIFKFNP